MDSLKLPIPLDIYASLLRECTENGDVVRGAEVHSHISRSIRQPGVVVNNRLLIMYLSCGGLDAARKLFDNMSVKDSVSWASMIAGYVDEGEYVLCLKLFKQMLENGFGVTSLIVVCVLKACIHVNEFELGTQIHGLVLKTGCISSSSDMYMGSLFIDFYGKFKLLKQARLVFDHLGHRDTVIWTAMIALYIQKENFDEGLELFKKMVMDGVKKNNFTFSCMIKACARIGDDGRCGKQVHADAIKLGVESNFFVECSLVDMYGKCGLLKDARKAFEMICNKRNVVCWNAMLSGYIRYGSYQEAIKFLYLMKGAGIQPQESMLDEVRIACGG
ncbi:hypothetical protein GIB67_005789 [Kingdonia uniflora]|uniref:Pentatricopeptide repeat-containing protein n=1 Tax=Kingdonia uniflora TaxID=39325 RepID=A0A7J7KVN9_9MAGN|nr:hypothetical protein GIB67_005789 [Kingdonia uniflora]